MVKFGMTPDLENFQTDEINQNIIFFIVFFYLYITGRRGRGTPSVLGTERYCNFECCRPDQYGGYNIMSQALTQEEVQNRLDKGFEQKVTLISQYINRRTNIRLRCEDCGFEWETLPVSVLYDNYIHKCPSCGVKKGQLVQCAYCGKTVYRTPSQLTKNQTGFFYCSRECGNVHKN